MKVKKYKVTIEVSDLTLNRMEDFATRNYLEKKVLEAYHRKITNKFIFRLLTKAWSQDKT
jgi:hypothetical protein